MPRNVGQERGEMRKRLLTSGFPVPRELSKSADPTLLDIDKAIWIFRNRFTQKPNTMTRKAKPYKLLLNLYPEDVKRLNRLLAYYGSEEKTPIIRRALRLLAAWDLPDGELNKPGEHEAGIVRGEPCPEAWRDDPMLRKVFCQG